MKKPETIRLPKIGFEIDYGANEPIIRYVKDATQLADTFRYLFKLQEAEHLTIYFKGYDLNTYSYDVDIDRDYNLTYNDDMIYCASSDLKELATIILCDAHIKRKNIEI